MPRQRRCPRCNAPVTGPFCSRCGTRQYGVDPDKDERPPGWYPDPFGRAALRLWDGDTWTGRVYTHGYGSDVLSLDFTERKASAWRATPGSLALSMGGLVAAFALSLLFVLPDILLGRAGGLPAALLLSETGLWTGLLGTCMLTSRRYGTGSLTRDFRIEARWIDAAIGVAGAVIARLIVVAAVIPIFAFHRAPTAPDHSLYAVTKLGSLGWAVLVIVSCVGAPLFEELFFRGLLQGQLTERFGPAVAVVVTAVVFGAAHFGNDPGFGGLVLAVGIGAGGLVLGFIRHLTGRLGSSMATHALFNASAMAILAATAVIR